MASCSCLVCSVPVRHVGRDARGRDSSNWVLEVYALGGSAAVQETWGFAFLGTIKHYQNYNYYSNFLSSGFTSPLDFPPLWFSPSPPLFIDKIKKVPSVNSSFVSGSTLHFIGDPFAWSFFVWLVCTVGLFLASLVFDACAGPVLFCVDLASLICGVYFFDFCMI